MKKRICALLAAMLLTGAAASADGLDFLKPIWMQMMDGGDSAEASIPQDVRVTCADERLTVEKYGVILENEHTAEAHIYAVLRNVSGKRLPIQTVQMKAVGANGKALHEERYVSHLPDVIEPGETMIVSEWMYDFTKDIGKVSGMEITVETSTRAYTRWTRLDGVRAWREGQYLCVELTNTTEETLYGAVCGAILEDADGRSDDAKRIRHGRHGAFAGQQRHLAQKAGGQRDAGNRHGRADLRGLGISNRRNIKNRKRAYRFGGSRAIPYRRAKGA